MDDLIRFLRDRLDSDQQLIEAYVAHEVAERGHLRGSYVIVLPPGWEEGEPFDTDRMLAEVAAKRAIVEDLTGYGLRGDDEAAYWHRNGHNYARFKVLKHLAQPYANDPNFRAEWRLGAGTTPPGD